jgi:hypothetical protein
LNRKFTLEEINQFYIRGIKNSGRDRNWIYNPFVHGDKDAFDHTIKLAKESKNITEEPSVRNKILDENKEKIKAGESIRWKPYFLDDYIDREGIKQGFERFPFMTGWKPIH